MMPDTKAAPAVTTVETQPVDDRKPWHAPTLTEVALQVTGQASGTTGDKAGSTTAL